MTRQQTRDNWLIVDAVILVESDKAFKLEVAEELEIWIPKSQMQFVSEVELTHHDSPGSVQTLVIKEWICNKTEIDSYCEPYIEDSADQFDDESPF